MTIQEVLRDHGVVFASHGEHPLARPNWIAIRNCPFCGNDRYYLGFNTRKRFFNCWSCRGHRTVVTLVRLGVPYAIAKDFARDAGPLPGGEIERTKLVEPAGRGPLLRIHRKYLEGRGFNPDELVRTWELEGIGRAVALSWRIYIPITFKERRVSWTTRTVGDVPARYISASPTQEAMNHKHTLYGLDFVRHSTIVVEGPADAWRVGPGAVATLGTGYSDAQVLLLSKVPYRYICFDRSPSAQRRANDLAAELAPFPGETHVVELDADDPGSASPKEIKMLRKAARMD